MMYDLGFVISDLALALTTVVVRSAADSLGSTNQIIGKKATSSVVTKGFS